MALAAWSTGGVVPPNWARLTHHRQAGVEELPLGQVRDLASGRMTKGRFLDEISDLGDVDVHYLFARAKKNGSIALTRAIEATPDDFYTREGASSAVVFGIFPVAWGRPHSTSRPWAEYARAAHGLCSQPLLGVSTLVPLRATDSASIGAHLTAAAVKACRDGDPAHPTVVAEDLIDWLRKTNHPTAPEWLLVAGNLGNPWFSCRIGRLANLSPAVLKKMVWSHISEDHLEEALSLLQLTDCEREATVLKGRLARLRKKQDTMTRQDIDAERTAIADRILTLPEAG